MDHRAAVELLARGDQLVSEAKRRRIRPRDRRAAVKTIASRQRDVRATINARRDGAARLLLSRRAESRKAFAAAVRDVARRAAEGRRPDERLADAISATCGVVPKRHVTTAAGRALAARRMPMRFIVDVGSETSVDKVAQLLSTKLGARVATQAAALPRIEPLMRRPTKHRYFVLTMPMSWGTGMRHRFLIASAIKHRAGLRSVQPSEPVTISASTVDLFVDPPPLDTEWPLAAMKVREAWDVAPAGAGQRRGAGEVVGHLDTGWFDHPEYDRDRLDLVGAYNAVTGTVGETASAHTFPPEGGPNESHGLATGALIVSAPAGNGATTVTTVPAEPGAPSPDSLEITGVAPDAQVLPVRCVDFVFVLDNVDLVRGAEYLVEPEDPAAPAKVGVISMSVGGVPHFTLEEVLNVGVRDKNVIAVAAAGQIYAGHLPIVAPAAYPEVIAVAASTATDEAAYWTFSGPEIEIAAPGENVWIADVRGEEQEDGTVVVNRYVGYGHGTSFSCALTAGVAALWRAFHADALNGGAYDGVPYARVFREHLRRTANRPRGWDTIAFGPGIVDVEALLSTPLPTPNEVPLPASVQPFNPFLEFHEAFEDFHEAWDGLQAALADLGARLLGAGQDAWNEAMVLLASGVATANMIVAAGIETAASTAAATADLISNAWTEVAAFADATGDEFGRRAAALGNELAAAWQSATESAEELAEQAAEAAEETADEVIETVEEFVEEASEAADDFVDWVGSLFG